MGGALLTWLMIWGIPVIRDDEFIYCDVHGFHYECAGHPQQFYMYVLLIACVLLVVYLFCCFYRYFFLVKNVLLVSCSKCMNIPFQ